MSKDIIQTVHLSEDISANEVTDNKQVSENDIDQDAIEAAFSNAVYGDRNQKIKVGNLKIWMTRDNELNYKVVSQDESNESILSILLGLCIRDDINLKEKVLLLQDDKSKVLNSLYTLIKTSNYDLVSYIQDLIEHSNEEININIVKAGYELPLIFALKYGTTLEMVQCLVEDFNADVNALDKDGHSPLYHALNMSERASFKTEIIKHLKSLQASLTPVEEDQLAKASSSSTSNDYKLASEQFHDKSENLSKSKPDDISAIMKPFIAQSTYLKQIAPNREVLIYNKLVAEITSYIQVLKTQATMCLSKAVQGEKNIPFANTNFILDKREDGSLNISYDVNSKVFKSLSEIANKLGIEIKFIYDKHTGIPQKALDENNYEDLIVQVLNDKKCLIIPSADLILQNDGNDKIECFVGLGTIQRLKTLSDVAYVMNETVVCYELRDVYTLPEELELSGDVDLPD